MVQRTRLHIVHARRIGLSQSSSRPGNCEAVHEAHPAALKVALSEQLLDLAQPLLLRPPLHELVLHAGAHTVVVDRVRQALNLQALRARLLGAHRGAHVGERRERGAGGGAAVRAGRLGQRCGRRRGRPLLAAALRAPTRGVLL